MSGAVPVPETDSRHNLGSKRETGHDETGKGTSPVKTLIRDFRVSRGRVLGERCWVMTVRFFHDLELDTRGFSMEVQGNHGHLY